MANGTQSLGLSFTPTARAAQRQAEGGGAPADAVQRAIQVLSLRLPEILGARPILAPQLLQAAAGGQAGGPLPAVAQSLLRQRLGPSAAGGPVGPTAPMQPSPMARAAPTAGPAGPAGPAGLRAPIARPQERRPAMAPGQIPSPNIRVLLPGPVPGQPPRPGDVTPLPQPIPSPVPVSPTPTGPTPEQQAAIAAAQRRAQQEIQQQLSQATQGTGINILDLMNFMGLQPPG